MIKNNDTSRDKLIILVGTSERYPYPYMGNIILHLNSSERKEFRDYLSKEIENAEGHLNKQKEYEKDWGEWGSLYLGNDRRMIPITIKTLGKLMHQFLSEDVVLSADDFRILSLQISQSIYEKDSISSNILGIMASGMKTYFILEKANERDINDWISDGVRKIELEAEIVRDSVMREFGLK